LSNHVVEFKGDDGSHLAEMHATPQKDQPCGMCSSLFGETRHKRGVLWLLQIQYAGGYATRFYCEDCSTSILEDRNRRAECRLEVGPKREDACADQKAKDEGVR